MILIIKDIGDKKYINLVLFLCIILIERVLNMKEVVELLKKCKKTISTMESCTGGGVANAITNIEGASEVLKYSAVTYSNEYKIKMGVSSDIIAKYTVYSMETACEMSKNIASFSNANIGVGITGQLNRYDSYNKTNENNIVYISIYDRDNDKFYNEKIMVDKVSRLENKEIVINKIICMLIALLN